MDEQRRAVQRRVAEAPTLAHLRALAALDARAGWTHGGRSLHDHLGVLARGWRQSAPPWVWARDLEAIGERAVPGLVDALSSPDPATRWNACWALALLGPAGQTATDALLERLLDDAMRVRDAARWALRSQLPGSLAAAVRAYQEGDVRRRAAAALLLGFFGVRALEAAPLLDDPALHGDASVRGVCRWALQGIRGDGLDPRPAWIEPLPFLLLMDVHDDQHELERELVRDAFERWAYETERERATSSLSAGWQPDRIVTTLSELVIEYFPLDRPYTEGTVRATLRRGGRLPFTQGELLLACNNELAKDYVAGEPSFEELRLLPGDEAPPVYEVQIGS